MSQQHIQEPQQTPKPQQTHVSFSQVQQQQQAPQQMRQVGQQLQGPQGSQISHKLQQITLQSQQISLQTQLQHSKQVQTTQIQPQSQQIPQQQQINRSQMIHQNIQQVNHTGKMIPQQTLNQRQQLNQQNQHVPHQHQHQQQIQQQSAQASQIHKPMSQQILQPNQSISQQNQELTQKLGISQSNSQMSVSQLKNQQVIQPQQPQHMQQAGQQYQRPQHMMQSQPQQLLMQNNQPIMYQPIYSQAQNLNAMQIHQTVMQIPTNTVTSTQMHIQQQQPEGQSNMMWQPQMSIRPQHIIQPIPMFQQQMTYSLQHVPINTNYANSMQNCYTSQQQIATSYIRSIKTVETVKKKEDNNTEVVDNGTTNNATTTVEIDYKIEQTIDLVKSHLVYAVSKEVEVLKEKIAELMDKVGTLETENSNLRMLVRPDILEQYNREKQKSTNGQSTRNQ